MLKIKVKLSLCLTKHDAMKTYGESEGICPRIIGLDTKWRCAVSFKLRPLYPHGKSPQHPLDRKLGEPMSRYGHGGDEKNSQISIKNLSTRLELDKVQRMVWVNHPTSQGSL
jgi:hypothetical protein